jgi:hypothetical protein
MPLTRRNNIEDDSAVFSCMVKKIFRIGQQCHTNLNARRFNNYFFFSA